MFHLRVVVPYLLFGPVLTKADRGIKAGGEVHGTLKVRAADNFARAVINESPKVDVWEGLLDQGLPRGQDQGHDLGRNGISLRDSDLGQQGSSNCTGD